MKKLLSSIIAFTMLFSAALSVSASTEQSDAELDKAVRKFKDSVNILLKFRADSLAI